MSAESGRRCGRNGLIRAIGVSNFYPDRLVDLIDHNDVTPAVNQFETHPYFQRIDDQRVMRDRGVQIESWGPFAEGRNNMFTDPALTAIGSAHGKTVAQVVLRWLIQREVVAIPKSVRKDRIEENSDVFDFEFTPSEMTTIAAMDTGTSLSSTTATPSRRADSAPPGSVFRDTIPGRSMDGPSDDHRDSVGITRTRPHEKEVLMSGWTPAELDRIERAEELDLASQRRDGSLRDPVTMWVVRDGDDLYVRSMYGRAGAWFRGTQLRRQGRIRSGGVEKDVSFVIDTDPALNDRIDAAYRDKYRSYGDRIVGGVVNPASRDSTIKLVPR